MAWIAEGEKFALIGLHVATEPGLADRTFEDGLEAYTSLKLDMPGHWREWLGHTSMEDIQECNLILASRLNSATPDILDGENQILVGRVGRWYTGLMLACPLNAYSDPISASGAMTMGELDFRQVGRMECPHDSIIALGREVSSEHLSSAAKLASALEGLTASRGPHIWRLMHCLRIYQDARSISDPMDRIHQFARCVEGLLATTAGRSKAQFKSRNELFVGPHHQATLGLIYDVRSEVEHLHEDRWLEPFDRTKRLQIAKLELLVSELCRNILNRIFSDPSLALRFGSRESLEVFWSLDSQEQRALWGPTYDLMSPLAGWRDSDLSDHDLGLEYAT